MSPRDELPNLYGVLEVSASATFDEIEEAYGKIRETLGGGGLALYSILEEDDAGQWRDKVEAAYRTLSDPDRRAAYDRHLRGETEYPPILVQEARAAASTTHAPVVEPVARTTDSALEVAVPYQGETPPPLSEPASDRVVAAQPKPRRLEPSGEVEITPDTEFSGTLLLRIRESARAELAQGAEITKIGKGYLRAIESNDFDSLPAPVYVRGFVVEYAKVLGLDSEQVASSFMALFERYRDGGR